VTAIVPEVPRALRRERRSTAIKRAAIKNTADVAPNPTKLLISFS